MWWWGVWGENPPDFALFLLLEGGDVARGVWGGDVGLALLKVLKFDTVGRIIFMCWQPDQGLKK